MTAAAAQVARPTFGARSLAMHMAFGQPARLSVTIDAFEGTHRALAVTDEAVACGQLAIGGHTKIASAGAARIRPVRAAMDLAHCIDHIGKRIAFACDQPPFERTAAVDHGIQHLPEIFGLHFTTAARRIQHRRKADAVKSGGDEIFERFAQIGCGA